MKIIEQSISLAELTELARSGFGEMVKAVVDVERGIMAVGGELHADAEALLLESGSMQEHLWGINLYPEEAPGPDLIEFDSMINIRPGHGNRSRGVDDPGIRDRIVKTVTGLVAV